MRTLLLLVSMIPLLTTACAEDSTVVFDARFSEVRALIIEQVNEEKVPSIAVAVAEDGRIIWEEAFGFSDIEARVHANPRTMYKVGSISKTITATGLMLLVEEGLVDLDAPAINYLPEHIRPRVFEGELEDITVRLLLNHRAGMPAYDESFYEDYYEGQRPFAETVRRYGIVVYPPGWSFIYCNLGYQMLGSIITQISGTSYADFIERRVFAPLGMTESRVYEGQSLRKPFSANYTQNFERIPPYLSGHPGAGGNYASAHDLIRFAMFHLLDHLPDQEAILSDESVKAMQAAAPPSHVPYAIGWFIEADEHGFDSVYHGGEEPGADAFMRIFPGEDVAAVILCNAECEKLYEIQKAIFEVLIPELGEPEPAEESSNEEAPSEPTEIYGTWAGRIEAYDRQLDVKLVIDSSGVRVSVGDQPKYDMEVWVLSPTFLLGMFDASIPTPDNERHPYRNRLAVVRDGDRLYGAVISAGSWEARAGNYELSSRVELYR
jgi:CubicO group peptidase (beta-lactamase class C family)